jgi:hypothetical protein
MGMDENALLQNANLNQSALCFCWKVLDGWMQFADDEVDLFPRNLKSDFYWNARDCAADNYPFLTLTAYFTDRYLFETRMKNILKMEQKLCNRVDRLPDDWDLVQRAFRMPEPKLADLILVRAIMTKWTIPKRISRSNGRSIVCLELMYDKGRMRPLKRSRFATRHRS